MSRLIKSPCLVTDLQLKGVIFDMDGTLCLPQQWMFKSMREALGILDDPIDILEHVYSLTPERQVEAQSKLAVVEHRAMMEMQPQPGLNQLMSFLQSNDISKGICTRNLQVPVTHLLSTFIPDIRIDPVVTRTFTPPKPSPEPLWHISKTWEYDPRSVIMVGDSNDDMRAGFSAGMGTILIKNEFNKFLWDSDIVDYAVESLAEIIELIENGLTLKKKA